MSPTHLAPSVPALTGRFLTFHEREEVAIELARGTGFARLHASSDVRRARFRAMCGATLRPVVAIWITGPVRRNGMRIAQQRDLDPASWRPILHCAPMWRNAFPARSQMHEVSALRGRR